MLHSRSKRGDRRRGRRGIPRTRGGVPLMRRTDREIIIEAEEEGEKNETQPTYLIGRALNKLGPKGRFLAFAILFAAGITVFWTYTERHLAEDNQAADRHNAAQVALGKSLYQANCAFCHGDKLEGKPGWDKNYPSGRRPALPLNGEGAIARLSDDDLFDLTKYGGQPFSPADYKNDMPGFEMQLGDADIWAILAYMKSVWPEEVIERQREMMTEKNG